MIKALTLILILNEKMNLNIIYTPQPEGPVLTYDNNGDHIWMSNSYKEGMPNIAMNNYSAIKIKKMIVYC